MKTSFRDLSIKVKLITIIMVGSGVALLVASSAILVNERLSFRRSLVDELSTLADLVGRNTAAALDFSDRRAAMENMATLRAEPTVIAAYVFTSEGLPFADYQAPRRSAPRPEPCSESHPFSGDRLAPEAVGLAGHQFCREHIDLFKPIVVDQQTLGTIYLQGDLGELSRTLWRYVGILGVVMAASLAAAFLLSSYLQRFISLPIVHLASTMRGVSRDRDYSVRVATEGNDEIGNLIAGFNEMLEKVQHRDNLLEEHREHLEEEVAKRTVELAQARDQALASSKAKSAFVANVSHEIRTPLHAVLGHTQLLRRDSNLSRDQLEVLATIEASGDHLLALINSILDLSKIEAGALELSTVDFDLPALLRELSLMFQARCVQEQLAWRLEGLDEEHLAVRADAHKLRQVLINLLGNAVKFTDSGEVTLSVARLSPDRFRFEVADTGPGMAPADLDRLSDPFHQGREGGLKGGTGLGLAIATEMIELMGGSLEIESELGKGSRFFFSICLPPSESPVAIPLPSPPPAPRLAAGSSVNALVVDDIEENIEVLARTLRQLGAEVAEAVNGREALEKVRARSFDIVFMDIRMPVMNGLEALEAMQSEFGEQAVPCVAVTASSLPEEVDDLLAAGFIDQISKPFQLGKIYDCLAQHLGVSYEDPEEESGRKLGQADMPNLAGIRLPADLCSRLRAAAALYQVSDLADLLTEVQALGPSELRLAEVLTGLVNDFDMPGLLRTLERLSRDG